MYAYATGGSFGLEDMVTTSGPGLTLLYQLFIPFFWCIPVSLVAAELTTAIPVEGGFYRWVRAGFGDFWGFQAGWWNWSASFLLGSSYGVLTADYFTNYLSFYFTIPGWMHYLIAVAVIALIGYINVRGIQMVGRVATILEISILAPIVVMCVIAATKWHHNPFSPLVPPHVPRFQVFGAGLALGLWLYSGYEQVSSVAEEVENPQRSYPIALAIVIPLSIATYFLPTMFSLAALGDWQKWHTGYFSAAAALIGGPWLGLAMAVAAMITNLSLLNATVLTSTRMPSTMAEDGYLSPVLAARHPRYGTPWIAIIASCMIYALLAQKTLVQLLTIYIWLRIGVNNLDGAGVVAAAQDAAGFGAAVPYSLGPRGIALRHHRAAGDECGGAGGERSVRAKVGAGAGAIGAGDVFFLTFSPRREDGGLTLRRSSGRETGATRTDRGCGTRRRREGAPKCCRCADRVGRRKT